MTDAADRVIPDRPAASPVVKIVYWLGEGDLNAVDDFRQELSANYAAASVEGAQSGAGGGLYTLFVEIAATVTLPYVVRLLLEGVAFDLIKLGTKKFVLRPLLAAQKRLRSRNSRGNAGDIAQLKLIFKDSVVTIDADSRVRQNVADSIGELLNLLARHYEQLALATGEQPTHVYIPVIEDTAEDRPSHFRAVLEVDENMRISGKVFFEYWGLTYSTGAVRVYDVARKLLIDEEYFTREVYWDCIRERWIRRGDI